MDQDEEGRRTKRKDTERWDRMLGEQLEKTVGEDEQQNLEEELEETPDTKRARRGPLEEGQEDQDEAQRDGRVEATHKRQTGDAENELARNAKRQKGDELSASEDLGASSPGLGFDTEITSALRSISVDVAEAYSPPRVAVEVAKKGLSRGVHGPNHWVGLPRRRTS